MKIEVNIYILGLVEFSMITLSLFYLQKLKPTKITLGITLFIWLVGLFLFLYLDRWIAIATLFIIVIAFLLFHTNILKISLDLSLIIFIGMIADHFSQLLYGSSKSVYSHLILFALLYSTIFLIINLVMHKKKIDRQYTDYSFLFKISAAIISCATVIILYLNIFVPTTYDEFQLVKINLIIQVSYLLTFITLFILLIKSLNEKNKLEYSKMQQSLHNEYVASLEAINDDMQKFRHDYLNILITMRGYITERDIDELEAYFNEKIVKAELDTLAKSLIMKNISNLKIVEIKGLLLTKLFAAVEKNISVQIEIPEVVDSAPIDVIDFSRILGIFIDNAIEASESANPSTINIAILHTPPNSILFVVQNSFSGEIDINKLYQSNFSTKNRDRGLGLKNALEISNGYSNVLVNTRIENERFIQEVELIGEE